MINAFEAGDELVIEGDCFEDERIPDLHCEGFDCLVCGILPDSNRNYTTVQLACQNPAHEGWDCASSIQYDDLAEWLIHRKAEEANQLKLEL